MKKKTFVALFCVEMVFALLASGMLVPDIGGVIYLIALALFAAVLTPFFLRLKRAEDEAQKRKIRRNILLIPVIPILVVAVLAVIVLIALANYYG